MRNIKYEFQGRQFIPSDEEIQKFEFAGGENIDELYKKTIFVKKNGDIIVGEVTNVDTIRPSNSDADICFKVEFTIKLEKKVENKNIAFLKFYEIEKYDLAPFVPKKMFK